jgi:hypothetical protein
MLTGFRAGDLVKMKPASEVFQHMPAADCLVLVTDELEESSQFFYGLASHDGKIHLWSYDQFYLLSKAGR